MSVNTNVIDTYRPTNIFFSKIRKVYGGILLGLEWARVYDSTYLELSRLSDRDLEDLGIIRYDIPKIAHEAANQKVSVL